MNQEDKKVSSTLVSPLQKQIALLVLCGSLLFGLALSLQKAEVKVSSLLPCLGLGGLALGYWLIQTWGLWRKEPYLWWSGLGRAFLCAGGIGIPFLAMKTMGVLDHPNEIPSIHIQGTIGLLLSFFLYFVCLAKAPFSPDHRTDSDLEIESSIVTISFAGILALTLALLLLSQKGS